ncbi:Tetratricopeptide repeat-containing domain [Macleaya cordata]|uniref:Tetratricopeptide repeat-containing domain n=1 Tax=Macleaya cordata TaxID=56857 RepID=A0A200QSH0_MACCD|nr:Tetratricopeptide repeat-containing domain [Macleaya cordata]
MILLRSSSTPIMSSMHEAGGSSRNSSKASPVTGNLHKISFPVDPSTIKWQSFKNMRRVSSDSNLNAMVTNNETEADSPVKFNERTRNNNFKSKPKLEPILSFSNYDGDVDEGSDEYTKNMDDYDKKVEFSFPLMDTGIEDNKGFGFFNFSNRNNFQEQTSLYMAAGLGIDPDLMMFKRITCDDYYQMERYYENILRENPCNPLILRNYAQYLYKIKKDYKRAEEFYSRAILAEPNDGEALSEYAKLRWEVHGEEEMASKFFVSAVHAAPENSDVLAAYASFLWETEERKEVGDATKRHRQLCMAAPY